jgi:hypothetical protein
MVAGFYTTSADFSAKCIFTGGKMLHCPECGTEVDEETTFCPNCGTPLLPLSGKSPRRGPKPSHVAIVIAVCIIVAMASYSAYIFLVRPQPDIVLVNGYDGFQGLQYVAFVDVRVKNNGGNGWVTVYAEMEASGYYEELNQRTYLASGQTKDLQFVFDISLLGQDFSAFTYRAWAVPY